MIDKDLIDSLQSTGIIDGYEYTLRKLVQDQLPTDNVYEKCAYYLLEYEKMYKKDNLRAKNLQEFVKMGEEKEEEKKQKTLQEIMPNYKVTLRSKIILERDMKTKNNELKVFETNIDELIKNRIQLSSHKLAMEEMERRQTNYGSFAAFALNENEKLRNYNFTTAPNFEPFEFIPILEIRKMNEMNNKDMNNFKNEDSRKGTIRSLSKVDDDNITDSSKRYGTEEGKSSNYKYTNSEKRNMMGESHEFVDDVIKSSKKEFDGKSSNVNNESEDVKSSNNNRTSNQNDNQSESQKSQSQKSQSKKSQSKKSQSKKSQSKKSESKISQSKISQSKNNDNTENNNDGDEEDEGNDDES